MAWMMRFKTFHSGPIPVPGLDTRMGVFGFKCRPLCFSELKVKLEENALLAELIRGMAQEVDSRLPIVTPVIDI